MEEYYLRLGHSIAANNMKNSGELYRVLYMGRLNPNIVAKDPEEYERIEKKIGPKYAEYEAMCRKVGKNYIIR